MDTHQPHTGEFDSLLDLETQFYSTGWNSGFPHGELHGLFEGRELGREKSWELWEEIGYYQGVARLWKVILKRQGKESTRSMQSLDQILALASAFPSSNDSTLVESASESQDLDITAQLSTLRSKYKTVCATLGIRSRMAAAQATEGDGSMVAAQIFDVRVTRNEVEENAELAEAPRDGQYKRGQLGPGTLK